MTRTALLISLIPMIALAQGGADAGSPGSKTAKAKPEGGKYMKMAREGKDLYATLQTSMGDIVVRLFSKDAPKTVENFVGLSTGEKNWVNPQGQPVTGKPLYQDVIFHRVIPNFMIQGGDPTGTGMGNPGYNFEDEFQSGRKFDKVGLLAMANSGPGTNGSQFFITTRTPLNHLNNRHTIFGEVISGYENVMAISDVARGAGDRPNTPVTIKKIIISDKQPKTAAPKK